jgi:FSR family fosmidomycin resistance protein-like MFS transporter
LAIPLLLLSLGHFFIDLYSGALGALQPLLVARFGMTLTEAGILGGVLVFSSSVMQPVYGFLSDRFHTKLFTALSPAVAGVFISTLGIAPNFKWMLGMVLAGGAGIAAFHPQASSRVTRGVTENRGAWMAAFISAGTLGMALGPTYFSLIATRFGLDHTWLAALPGVLVSIFLLVALPNAANDSMHRERFDWKPLKAVARPLTILYMLVFLRSIVQICFSQFLPLYLHLERGYTPVRASYILTIYLAAGALGGFLGGHMSDRFGGRNVILISMIASVPFLALFFFTRGTLSILGLCLGGLILLFTIPVNVVMAQELVPSQSGTVSALMMGFAWGMAGMVFIPLVGMLADSFTLHRVLASLTVFPLIGFFLTMKLEKS